jgi:hypothetical protein
LDFDMPPHIISFWGKASPTDQAGPTSHSIVYHSLDVTASLRLKNGWR